MLPVSRFLYRSVAGEFSAVIASAACAPAFAAGFCTDASPVAFVRIGLGEVSNFAIDRKPVDPMRRQVAVFQATGAGFECIAERYADRGSESCVIITV